MTVQEIRVSASWLDLREAADGAARSRELVGQLVRRVEVDDGWVIHDLASGTGSMARWLAPLLPGPQRWVLHDRDADLLAIAGADVPVETRVSDVTRLTPDDFAGATLITASALLDLLTGDELTRLIRACAGAGCPLLLAISVTGRVRLHPADPLDDRIAAAFNAHQRRGGLLGPDAVDAAVTGFRDLGAEVVVRQTPWRLGAVDRDLAVEWLAGWVDAACEQDPELIPAAARYRRSRLTSPFTASVGHADLLVLP